MRRTSIRQPRRRGALGAIAAATLAASLGVALIPVTALAVNQTPKNGCNSTASYSGQLTSPAFSSPPASGEVTFDGWFEGESVSPSSFDRATVLYSIDDGAQVEFGNLKFSAPVNSGGNDDIGYSNNGTGAAPSFEQYTFPYPVEAQNETGVKIHFRFATGDSSYNGFRGFGVDDVSIDTSTVPSTQDFESGVGAWAFDPQVNPGEPFWHILDNPQNTTIKNPEINPNLVTLAGGDSGALPVTPDGDAWAWFGDDASGTFCGPDFANLVLTDTQPPETTITLGPASTVSPNASFSFTSSEPGSSFLCRVDAAAFGPCSGPGQSHSVSGLSWAAHTFQVLATDGAGNTDATPATHSWTVLTPPVPPPLTLADLPKPSLGEDVNVQAKSGVVLVGVRTGAASSGLGARASQKGITFVPLAEARQIPVGSLLDTSKGVVTLQSARNKKGATQKGNFSKGLFQVLQSRKAKGLTDLALKGSSFKSCKPAKKRGKKRGKRRGKGSGVEAVGSAGRTIRRLSGNAKGRFRTRGRRSAATVRGTIWNVTDRCDGTLTKVKRGKVAVRDFRRKKTIVLKAGKSYLAR